MMVLLTSERGGVWFDQILLVDEGVGINQLDVVVVLAAKVVQAPDRLLFRLYQSDHFSILAGILKN